MSDEFNNERFRSTEGQEGVDVRNAISRAEKGAGLGPKDSGPTIGAEGAMNVAFWFLGILPMAVCWVIFAIINISKMLATVILFGVIAYFFSEFFSTGKIMEYFIGERGVSALNYSLFATAAAWLIAAATVVFWWWWHYDKIKEPDEWNMSYHGLLTKCATIVLWATIVFEIIATFNGYDDFHKHCVYLIIFLLTFFLVYIRGCKGMHYEKDPQTMLERFGKGGVSIIKLAICLGIWALPMANAFMNPEKAMRGGSMYLKALRTALGHKETVSVSYEAEIFEKAYRHSTVLRRVNKGTVLKVRGLVQDGFLPIEHNGVQGYVFAGSMDVMKDWSRSGKTLDEIRAEGEALMKAEKEKKAAEKADRETKTRQAMQAVQDEAKASGFRPYTATTLGHNATIRHEPRMFGPTLKNVGDRAKVRVIGEPRKGWYPVEHQGVKGWIGGAEIRIDE